MTKDPILSYIDSSIDWSDQEKMGARSCYRNWLSVVQDLKCDGITQDSDLHEHRRELETQLFTLGIFV